MSGRTRIRLAAVLLLLIGTSAAVGACWTVYRHFHP